MLIRLHLHVCEDDAVAGEDCWRIDRTKIAKEVLLFRQNFRIYIWYVCHEYPLLASYFIFVPRSRSVVHLQEEHVMTHAARRMGLHA